MAEPRYCAPSTTSTPTQSPLMSGCGWGSSAGRLSRLWGIQRGCLASELRGQLPVLRRIDDVSAAAQHSDSAATRGQRPCARRCRCRAPSRLRWQGRSERDRSRAARRPPDRRASAGGFPRLPALSTVEAPGGRARTAAPEDQKFRGAGAGRPGFRMLGRLCRSESFFPAARRRPRRCSRWRWTAPQRR